MRATSWSPKMTLPLSKLDVHIYGCISMTAFPSSPPRLTLHNSLLPSFPFLIKSLSVNSNSRHRLPISASASASVSADSNDGVSAVQSRKAFGNGRDFRFDINAVEILVLLLFLFMALEPTGLSSFSSQFHKHQLSFPQN